MNRRSIAFIIFFATVFSLIVLSSCCYAEESITLPPPETKGTMSVEEAIGLRRSLRVYKDQEVSKQELSQLFYAGQGATAVDKKKRSVPSAGAIYPMTLYACMKEGVYRYNPKAHTLTLLEKKDVRAPLAESLVGQSQYAKAPLIIVIVADVKKTERIYKDRAIRYCDLEAGHIAQNMALQAVALKMGLVTIGAFRDNEIRKLLKLPDDRRICYVLPVGHR